MRRVCLWSTIVAILLGWLLVTSREGAVNAALGSGCADLQKEKAATYGFHPSHISKEERKTKSAQMDEFWKSVKSHGQPGLECLKQLILNERQDGFFVFDAASLLISLDQSPASLEVARIGISKTNLKDVDSSGYIRNTLFLFHKGLDITPLVEHYMTAPEVKGFVPQHAMRLDRETGAFFLYGSMSSASADQSLIRMLNSKELSTRSAAAVLLSLSLTKESFKALKTVNRTSLPEPTRQAVESAMKYQRIEKSGSAKKSRAEVVHTLSRIPKYGEDFYGVAGDEEFAESAIAFLQEEDLPALREARRKSIYGLSDEALGEYFALSRVLLGVINRLDLYRDVREH